MKALTIQGIVLVVMLLALPLTSLGTSTDATWAGAVGLGLLGVAALVPPTMRFVGPDATEDEDAGDPDAEDAEGAEN